MASITVRVGIADSLMGGDLESGEKSSSAEGAGKRPTPYMARIERVSKAQYLQLCKVQLEG